MMTGVTKLLPAHNPYARPKVLGAVSRRLSSELEDGRLSPNTAEERRKQGLEAVAKRNRRKEFQAMTDTELEKKAVAVIPADILAEARAATDPRHAVIDHLVNRLRPPTPLIDSAKHVRVNIASRRRERRHLERMRSRERDRSPLPLPPRLMADATICEAEPPSPSTLHANAPPARRKVRKGAAVAFRPNTPATERIAALKERAVAKRLAQGEKSDIGDVAVQTVEILCCHSTHS